MGKLEVWPYLSGWPWLPPGHQVHRTLKEMLLKEEGSSAVMTKRTELQFPAVRKGSASVELWKEGCLIHPAPKCVFRHDWVKFPWKPCPEARKHKGGITVVGSMKGRGKEDTV